MILALACIAALCASYALTAWLLRHSRVGQCIDQPNARSSHSVPTPRGGGLSMVAVISCGVLLLYAAGALPLPLTATLLVGGLSVAAVGFWDDVRAAPIAVRIGVHFGAAILAVYCLGSVPGIEVNGAFIGFGAMAPILTVLAIVWTLNLFNFMDGIDGIATSEAACILFSAAAIGAFFANCPAAEVAAALIAGAACMGFLKWNWPPASIFMGDIGSGYLGYIIVVLAIAFSHACGLNIFAWLILGGVFFVDATLTLIRRCLRRESVFSAHRSHAYQWLARRWGSHRKVTVAVVAINLLWLLPCAVLAVKFSDSAARICLLALAPLTALALISGSGRAE
jgi:Fuc2NAc and GlcNAc transferase